jgi:hypothetical protein
MGGFLLRRQSLYCDPFMIERTFMLLMKSENARERRVRMKTVEMQIELGMISGKLR